MSKYQEVGRLQLEHVTQKLATIQNQKNFTLKIFQLAEFVTQMNANSKQNSSPFHIHSNVPQGSILGPLLYVLYTSELPTSITLGKFADDTAIFAVHEDSTIASLNIQEHSHVIEKWLKKWKVKVNESKSSHKTFTLRKSHCPAANINKTIIPQTEVVKYLGLHFHCALLALHPPISPLTSLGQRNRASWASQPQKSVTLLPCPGGKTTKSVKDMWGIG